MSDLIAALGPALTPLLDMPFALFGHSMGSLVAFEFAAWLQRTDTNLPVHLFVSGRRSPSLPDADTALHALDDAGFIRAIVERYNGIPQVILQDPELLQLFLPTLRADLEVVETYNSQIQTPLPLPISAFAGLDDRRAQRPDLAAWQVYSQFPLAVQQFPGDHFYLQPQRAALLDSLTRTLNAYLERRA